MQNLCSRTISFSTTWHMSVYEITYKTIGQTHHVIYTAEEMGEYSPPKKGMEVERNLSLTLSIINTKILLETHKIFHLEK